ncbi:hypothetical protein Tco_0859485 [Tanacetum coccineum]|uniref:Uncharacterized protein n=1 Tax=Tanacetum coccineum TaxID=301880 RepID=A0ABQ5BD43_9ASTR
MTGVNYGNRIFGCMEMAHNVPTNECIEQRVNGDQESSISEQVFPCIISYSEKEGFDPENHSIVQFTSVKKEVTVEDFFRGGVKTMVGHIRDSDSVCMRFKVIVRVIDATGSASLLLFDDFGVFKLSDEQCVHLIRQHGENYDDYFSEELNVLVGKRLLFRFHYTDDHINNNNHVYQVKMLSQDEAMITMFKKDFILEEPEVDLQTPVPSNANSSRFTNVDNIPFKLDETSKSSYVATKGNASHVDGEHSSMEIESDAGGSGSGK